MSPSFPNPYCEHDLAEKHRTEEVNNGIIIRYGDLPVFWRLTQMPIIAVYEEKGQSEWTHPYFLRIKCIRITP